MKINQVTDIGHSGEIWQAMSRVLVARCLPVILRERNSTDHKARAMSGNVEGERELEMFCLVVWMQPEGACSNCK